MNDLKPLDALFEQMGVYVKMETEIPFDEFQDFYSAVTVFLQSEYQNLSEDDLVRMTGITMIMAANAKMRALRKDENRKKFVKMAEKTAFWEDAIRLRLNKCGMSKDILDQSVGALWS